MVLPGLLGPLQQAGQTGLVLDRRFKTQAASQLAGAPIASPHALAG